MKHLIAALVAGLFAVFAFAATGGTPAQQDFKLQAGDALIIVDVQNDFLPGGSLAVPQGDKVVPVFNEYIGRFASQSLPVFATRDWHPADHSSFKERGGIWPPHCVQNTKGAEFAPGLALTATVNVISKAMERERDAYSGFQGTDLADRLRQSAVKRVFIGGLATDYCVLNTVKDALKEGFVTILLLDAVRGVDVKPGDSEAAIAEMLRLGAHPSRLEHIH